MRIPKENIKEPEADINIKNDNAREAEVEVISV